VSKPSPIDWQRLRAAREVEVESLRGLAISEVTPSRRDFTRFIGSGRGDVAVIAALRRRDPWSGATWDDLDSAAAAAALDEAEVAALAVAAEPLLHAGQLEDLRAVADAATAPLLRDDPIVHPLQVFQTRSYGADACVAAAPWIAADTLAEIVRTASSLHMSAVLGIFAAAEVDAVLPYSKSPIGVWAAGPEGEVDLERLRGIAAKVPPQRTLILLGDVTGAPQFRALRGVVDAAVVGRLFRGASDAQDVLDALTA